MSISPPTDIVLDVARAVDPERYRQAVKRLDSLSATAEVPFSAALDAAATANAPATPAGADTPNAAPASDQTGAYESFEAMALANLLEAAMPDDAGGFFGKGVAGDTWKSMLIEQLGVQLAKAGGIGIATQLMHGAETALASVDPASVDATRTLLKANAERSLIGAIDSDAAVADDQIP